jgi:hypothetical protein
MAKWHGTGLQTSWLRLSGARPMRTDFYRPVAWACAGCGKPHAGKTERNIALDGKNYCNRTFYQLKAIS